MSVSGKSKIANMGEMHHTQTRPVINGCDKDVGGIYYPFRVPYCAVEQDLFLNALKKES
jgi:hypothetical protein